MNVITFLTYFGIVFIVLCILFTVKAKVHAEDFKYNQTKQMKDEELLLKFCESNTTIKIPDVDKFCGLAYGGIDTIYGDKIN